MAIDLTKLQLKMLQTVRSNPQRGYTFEELGATKAEATSDVACTAWFDLMERGYVRHIDNRWDLPWEVTIATEEDPE